MVEIVNTKMMFDLYYIKNLSNTFRFTAIAAIILTAGLTLNTMNIFNGYEVKAYPNQQKEYQHNDDGVWGMKPGGYAFGRIASLQNDANGTTWIISGDHKSSWTEKQDNREVFVASFDMMTINGTAVHDHKIYNFTLTDRSIPNNHTMIYNGTGTITMKGSLVHNVPINIVVMGYDAVRISSDSEVITNHFGDTPIYGTVIKSVIVNK